MRIGITERGDASRDFSWTQTINNVDGAILITKHITPEFIQRLMQCNKPVIVHATCTGWGGTWLEPNVPTYENQLNNIIQLIEAGFPKNRIVLRIDPIIPTEEGIQRFRHVIDKAYSLKLIPDLRIRISVMDQYPHVRQRLLSSGHNLFYNGSFQASTSDMLFLDAVLSGYSLTFEACAESNLDNVEHVGCISSKDINILGLSLSEMSVNPQNRRGCLCLNCKTELLNNKRQCENSCLYCYWKGTQA